MKKFFQAQSTLELIMVIILVLVGIIVMGPYVVRSVNAYMRSWEISASQANSNPNVILNPSEIPGGAPPTVMTCGHPNFQVSKAACELNNGSLDCTWKETWTTSPTNPSGGCQVATSCVATTTLSQCQLPYGNSCSMLNSDPGACNSVPGCGFNSCPGGGGMCCIGAPNCSLIFDQATCTNTGPAVVCHWHNIAVCKHPWFPGQSMTCCNATQACQQNCN